ncbi:ribonuclease H-like domain-containing protein [Tanacetum coccineum]
MQHCNPCRTLFDTESKLGPDGDPVSDSTLYSGLASALQNLTFTRPDISYDYVRGTLNHALQLHVSTTTQLTAYTNVDWITLSRSSEEVEYRGVANVVAETAWIRNLLWELHTATMF